MWGRLSTFKINKIVKCEYTNVFDVCNVTIGQSPISMDYVYTDEDTSILTDLADIFNDIVNLIHSLCLCPIFPLHYIQLSRFYVSTVLLSSQLICYSLKILTYQN